MWLSYKICLHTKSVKAIGWPIFLVGSHLERLELANCHFVNSCLINTMASMKLSYYHLITGEPNFKVITGKLKALFCRCDDFNLHISFTQKHLSGFFKQKDS